MTTKLETVFCCRQQNGVRLIDIDLKIDSLVKLCRLLKHQ